VSALRDPRFIALLRVGLGVLFVMAAWPKLGDPAAFATSVTNYHMLPATAERVLALVLPPLELLVGVALIVGAVDAGASLLAFALMIVFTDAVGTALARGLDISCGCFETEGGTKVGLAKIVENVGLTAAAFWVWKGDRSFLSLGGRRRR
jgi:putative oxidoreductase